MLSSRSIINLIMVLSVILEEILKENIASLPDMCGSQDRGQNWTGIKFVDLGLSLREVFKALG